MESSFSVNVHTRHFHVTKPDTRGSNSMYNNFRNKTYLFQLDDDLTHTNHTDLKIYTNDYRMKYRHFKYSSDRRFPSESYQLSILLTQFFRLQRVMPRTFQNKVFSLIRNKLLDRLKFIRCRLNNHSCNNRSTRTFFKFSYKRYRFHFGIFIACPKCPTPSHNVPCVKVFSNNRSRCCFHPVSRDSKLKSVYSKEKALAAMQNSWEKSLVKTVINNRLGVSYKTCYTAVDSQHHLRAYKKNLFDFKVVSHDYQGLPFKPSTLIKQDKLRYRTIRHKLKGFTRSPHNLNRKLKQHKLLCAGVPVISYLPQHVQHSAFKLSKYRRFLPPSGRRYITPDFLVPLPVRSELLKIRDYLHPPLPAPPKPPLPIPPKPPVPVKPVVVSTVDKPVPFPSYTTLSDYAARMDLFVSTNPDLLIRQPFIRPFLNYLPMYRSGFKSLICNPGSDFWWEEVAYMRANLLPPDVCLKIYRQFMDQPPKFLTYDDLIFVRAYWLECCSFVSANTMDSFIHMGTKKTNSTNRSFKAFLSAARLTHNDTKLNPCLLTPFLEDNCSSIVRPAEHPLAQLSFSFHLRKRACSLIDTLEHLCSSQPKRFRPLIDHSKNSQPGVTLPDSASTNTSTPRMIKYKIIISSSDFYNR